MTPHLTIELYFEEKNDYASLLKLRQAPGNIYCHDNQLRFQYLSDHVLDLLEKHS